MTPFNSPLLTWSSSQQSNQAEVDDEKNEKIYDLLPIELAEDF